MIRGVIYTHAELGKALHAAVESFMGPQDELSGFSNAGLGGEEMLETLREAVEGARDGVIVFTTLFGGSCWQTAERLRREHSRLRHVTGVNLPMLLAFINKRPHTDLDALTEMVVAYGRKGIQS